MEMTGLDLTTFSITPIVMQTQVATFNALPLLKPPHVWRTPYLENYTYTENDDLESNNVQVRNSTVNNYTEFKSNNVPVNAQNFPAKSNTHIESGFDIVDTNYVQVQNSTAEDILYDQILQMEQFGGEAIQKYSNTPEQNDSFANGITMEVIDSGKQGSVEENGKMEGKLKENSTVGSTSKSQDTAITKSPKTSRKTTHNRRRREKANEREKQRIVVLKNAMHVLKNAIPAAREKTKITKLEVLKLARDYINSLRAQLMEETEGQSNSYQLESP